MLDSINLDDQTFEEIMEFVLGKLPWLAPAWTDHNAHDPGITILELMAWYKELQQFHLNTVTDAMRRKLLKLVGVEPAAALPARCSIVVPHDSGCKRALSRLETTEGIPFELNRELSGGAEISAIYIQDSSGHVIDFTDTLGNPNITLRPFEYGGDETSLLIGFSGIQSERLELWFNISDERSVARNAFGSASRNPREIEWSFEGVGGSEPFSPESDETHMLSISGYIGIRLPEDWQEVELGGKRLRYIRLRLTDCGCEESVRLESISANRHDLTQRETWSHLTRLCVDSERELRVTLTDELSNSGLIYLFLRTDSGLSVLSYSEDETGSARGRTLVIDASGAVTDGDVNLFVVSVDQMHLSELIYPSTGLPNMEIRLPLNGRTVLTEQLGLICDTLTGDGVVPALWRYTDDLGSCGSEDRVFTLDQARECLMFGDGGHGSIIPRGEGAVLIAPLALSYCGKGNVPEGKLFFSDDGSEARSTAAYGGAPAQTVGEAGRQFLHKLQNPRKCASERDYERAALQTPGLRVAAAKAVAGYDPDEPSGVSRLPVVTVIAVPYSGGERPMPDARFLEAVRMHIESLRPICTKIMVSAPRYVPIGITVQVRASGRDVELNLREAMAEYLSLSKHREIADPVVKNDLAAQLMKVPGVYAVLRLELLQLGSDCYTTPGGDIRIPRNAVPYLATMDIDVK